jgi:hypothetical protein
MSETTFFLILFGTTILSIVFALFLRKKENSKLKQAFKIKFNKASEQEIIEQAKVLGQHGIANIDRGVRIKSKEKLLGILKHLSTLPNPSKTVSKDLKKIARNHIASNILWSTDNAFYNKNEFILNLEITKVLHSLDSYFESENASLVRLFKLPDENSKQLRTHLEYLTLINKYIDREENAIKASHSIIIQIPSERQTWVKAAPSKSMGKTLITEAIKEKAGISPIADTVGGMLLDSFKTGMERGGIFNSFLEQVTKEDSITITPSDFSDFSFDLLPIQVKCLKVMHGYVFALYSLYNRFPEIIPNPSVFSKFNELQLAVIGNSLALLGNDHLASKLSEITKSDDWLVRLLAFEGMITLTSNSNSDFHISTQDIHNGLLDEDFFVSSYLLIKLSKTSDPLYAQLLMNLSESFETKDSSEQGVWLIVFFNLAKFDNQSAKEKLNLVAKNNQDKSVRKEAANLLELLLNPSPVSKNNISTNNQQDKDKVALKNQGHQKHKKLGKWVSWFLIPSGILLFLCGISMALIPSEELDTTDSVWFLSISITCLLPAVLFIVLGIIIRRWVLKDTDLTDPKSSTNLSESEQALSDVVHAPNQYVNEKKTAKETPLPESKDIKTEDNQYSLPTPVTTVEVENAIDWQSGSPFILKKEPNLEEIINSLDMDSPQIPTEINEIAWEGADIEFKRVSMIIAYLHHPDPQVKLNTLSFITDIKDETLNSILFNLLREKNLALQKAILNIYWREQSGEACQPLFDSIQNAIDSPQP